MKMDSFVCFIYYCSPCGGHGVFDYSVLGVGMGVWGGGGGERLPPPALTHLTTF